MENWSLNSLDQVLFLNWIDKKENAIFFLYQNEWSDYHWNFIKLILWKELINEIKEQDYWIIQTIVDLSTKDSFNEVEQELISKNDDKKEDTNIRKLEMKFLEKFFKFFQKRMINHFKSAWIDQFISSIQWIDLKNINLYEYNKSQSWWSSN